MVRPIAFGLAITLPLVIQLAFANTAAAQHAKKLSHEQAWAKCKARVDATVPGDQQTTRATVGGDCMRSYGYRLKRKM
jgi:hypothetical protein